MKLQCRDSDLDLLSVSAATPLGVITVPGDSDLETCRLLIERLHDNLDQVQQNRTTVSKYKKKSIAAAETCFSNQHYCIDLMSTGKGSGFLLLHQLTKVNFIFVALNQFIINM